MPRPTAATAISTIWLLLLIAAAPATSVPATSVPATTAPATTAPAFTEHDYRRALLEYNRRALLEPYQRSGPRDAKWDAQARQYLDDAARFFAYNDAVMWYWPAGTPSLAAMLKAGQALRAAGCDHPLVLYCHARLLHFSGKGADARLLLDPVIEPLFSGRYPLHVAASAAHRLSELTPEATPSAKAVWQRYVDAAKAMLVNADWPGLERRFVVAQLTAELGKLPIGLHRNVVQQFARLDGADQWIANVLKGRYHVRAAWIARGTGWANTVSKEAWEVFFAELTQARDALVKAHELHPEHPEAAVTMIGVATGAGDRLRLDARQWFDRAVAAQVDVKEAYEIYRGHLKPRWHGSHEAMYEFGVECAQARLFDTRVPYQLLDILQEIADDSGDSTFWRRPGVYEQVRDVCLGYAEDEQRPRQNEWYLSYLAAIAWRTDRFEESRRLIERLGKNLQVEAFARLRVLPRLAISHVHAMTGPAAAVVREAEQHAAAGQYEEAARLYASAIETGGAQAKPFLAGRRQELKWLPTFEAGEWVDIQPTDADLAAWYSLHGQWTVDVEQKQLVGRADKGATAIVCHAGFLGTEYELAGTVDFAGSPATSTGGPIAAFTSPVANLLVSLSPADHRVVLLFERSMIEMKPLELKHTNNTFRVVMKGPIMSAWVNDGIVFGEADLSGRLAGPRYYVGCGSRSNQATAARYSNLRVRKLPPGGGAAREAPAADRE